MSSVSPTEKVLTNLVDYKKTDPSEYAPKTEGGHNDFRNTLNEHLEGVRGKSLVYLLFKSEREKFEPNDVRLGLTPSCPMPLRKEIIAQHNYRANENMGAPVNEDSIRVTNLMAATLGMALSLTYRVVRAALRILFSPITFLYALHQQSRYNVKGWAKEDLRRISWEIIDVGTTLLTFFAGIINTFHPNAIKLDGLRDYYIKRTDKAISKNQKFAEAKKAYLTNRDEMRQKEKEAKSHLDTVEYSSTDTK